MTLTTLNDIHLDINCSDIDKVQTGDMYKQTLAYSFNDVLQLARKAILEKAMKNKRKSTAPEFVKEPKEKRLKKDSTISNESENKREAQMPERVKEPKKKRSKKDSTNSNGNENPRILESEIVLNECRQKP